MGMMSGTSGGAAVLTSGLLLAGCEFERPMSGAQMRQALDQVVLTGEARALEDGIIEITTHFTLGDGVASIVDEVRTFASSQIPCSTIDTPDPGTLVFDFGSLNDGCSYRGKTYAGVVTVSWVAGPAGVTVTHEYAALTDGDVTIDGRAVVDWTEQTRHVRTDFVFAGESTTVEVESDRTQTLLGGFGEGIQVVGTRDWNTSDGAWALDIDDVELRAADPVPQSGRYTLRTPDDADVSLRFERVDDDTIEVTLEAPRREAVFHVTRAGDIEEA